MKEFTQRLSVPFCCLLPCLASYEAREAVDLIEVPWSELPYEIEALATPISTPDNHIKIERRLDEAAIAYIGGWDELNLSIAEACRRRQIPYIMISEQTYRTERDIIRATAPDWARRVWRNFNHRLAKSTVTSSVSHAIEIHANGYPTYNELAPFNSRRKLFFDTRARAEEIISEGELLNRLNSRLTRPARLIYTGRYHPIKGALDVVKVGIDLGQRGLDFRLDLFGTGPLKEQMETLAQSSAAAGKIIIHDAVPYPELQSICRQADLFLCCHVQGDPSCTYLETFACGVPIAGYANEMWTPLCRESDAGVQARKGDVRGLAQAVERLLNSDQLNSFSINARAFALAHTMESAWDLRAARLAELLESTQRDTLAQRERSAWRVARPG